mgnify:CR=1 FL=1
MRHLLRLSGARVARHQGHQGPPPVGGHLLPRGEGPGAEGVGRAGLCPACRGTIRPSSSGWRRSNAKDTQPNPAVCPETVNGDISAACGYPNQLHFSRAFKKRYGVPPREWRLADVGDLLHGKLPAVVLLHKGDGLLDVEVLEPGAVELPPGGGGLDQPVQEQAQVPDQVEGGGLGRTWAVRPRSS